MNGSFWCLFISSEDSSDEDVADAGVHDADVLSEVSPVFLARLQT